MRQALKLVVPLALMAGLVAGCGGLSKEELVTKANAICANTAAELDKLKQPSNLADPNAANAYFGKLVPIAEKQLTDLRALKPPDEIKAAYDAFIAADEKFVGELKELVAAAKAKDAAKGVRVLGQLQMSGRDLGAKAKTAGLTKCAD
jgi:hypothetical protein